MNENQKLREVLFIASDHLDMSAFELSHPKEADLIRAALAQPAEGGEVVAPQDGRWYWVQYEGLGRNYEAPAMFKKQADAFYSYEFSGIPARQVTVIRSIERTTPPASVVPDGYALIAVNVLKAWGKLEEVQAACVYPIASTPTSQEQAQQPNEPNCNRSACGDFSPGPCDNPDCTALHKAQQPQAQAQELPDEHPFRIAAYLRSSIAPQHPESNGITKAADLIEAMHRAALIAGDAVDAQRYRWLADCNNYEAGLALIIDPKLTEQALGAAIDAAILVRGEGDPLTRYRVWPDGTVQEGAESPYAWMSDDFEYVDATDEEQAALSAAMRKDKP